MPLLGCHMSIAGGYWKAVQAAAEIDCDCVQLFTKNNNQWRAKTLTDKDAELFKNKIQETGVSNPISHASYLINLASPKTELRQKSVDAMVVEIERADKLGIPFVVFHPGSYTTSSEEEGLLRIVESLNEIHQRTDELATFPLLENTAGQGSNLGWKFDHLGEIIRNIDDGSRIGVCIDTCHAFAAGYAMSTIEDYEQTIEKMKRGFGIRKIKAFHLNDSKKPFGSRRDRHEHIGEGEMGVEPFRNLLNDKRFQNVPMYLETEKGERDGLDYDVMNMDTLRSLVAD